MIIKNGYVYAGTGGASVWKRSLSEIISVNNISKNIPECYKLYQNYPNPFNPVTRIKFQIPGNAEVKIEIFDIIGRKAAVLVDDKLLPGIYETSWNAADYPSGIYICRIKAGDYTESRKMVLIK